MGRRKKTQTSRLRERLFAALLDGRIALYTLEDGAACEDGPLFEVADALRWVALACDVSGLANGQQREIRAGFDTCAHLIRQGVFDAGKTRAIDCALAASASVIDAHLKPEALALAWAMLTNDK